MKAGVAGACAALLALGGAAAQASQGSWRNLDTGRPLQPGVYGRIAVPAGGEAPPLVHARPVVAGPEAPSATGDPLYLYVPPGQLRRWGQHCAKWQACERPVYFVRVDDSPSRLGDWKKNERPRPQTSLVRDALDLIASQ